MDKKKNLTLTLIALLTIVLLTAGATYAFFSYAKEGTTDNIITTGSITFLYTEIDGVGNGISIENAFPMSDEVGKNLSKTNEYFDFKITSDTTSSTAIPYEVTARKSKTSDNIDEYVRVYLTKENEEVLLDNYDNLTQTFKVDENKYTEKTVYTGKVPANQTNYEENFRLRMWLREGTRFENEAMNNKIFTLTVNVYANAKVVTQEEIDYESSTEITTISVEDSNLTKVEGQEYDYETTLPEGTTSTTINVETENPNATVTVEKLDSLVKTNNVKKIATVTKTLELAEGINYFKVTVTSENKKNVGEYIFKINVEIPYDYISGQAVTTIDGSKWHVLLNSRIDSEYVTLLSDYNLNDDGTYNTECQGKQGDSRTSFRCSVMQFDSLRKNRYDTTRSVNIGYFIRKTYEPLVTSALPGTKYVSLPGAGEIATADGKTLSGKEYLEISSSWLLTTNYWTTSSKSSSDEDVWAVDGYDGEVTSGSAGISNNYGARPKITTLKSNLLVE